MATTKKIETLLDDIVAGLTDITESVNPDDAKATAQALLDAIEDAR